jgi:hypothetical protein
MALLVLRSTVGAAWQLLGEILEESRSKAQFNFNDDISASNTYIIARKWKGE